MTGDAHGAETQEVAEAAQDERGQQTAQKQSQVSGVDWEKAIAERDGRIAELEAQVADAAKNAEAAEALRGEIAELKAQCDKLRRYAQDVRGVADRQLDVQDVYKLRAAAVSMDNAADTINHLSMVGLENAKLRELCRDMLRWMPCPRPCSRCERYEYPGGCEFERRRRELGIEVAP